MPTIWHDNVLTYTPRQFVLANGDVITEPATEITDSGRKVRLKDAPHVSFWNRDYEDLVQRFIDIEAEKRHTAYWMPVDVTESALENRLGYPPQQQTFTFDATNTDWEQATAWWSFTHPNLPVAAYLALRWGRASAENHFVETYLVVPHQSVGLDAEWQAVKTISLRSIAHGYSTLTEFQQAFMDWIVHPEWVGLLGRENKLNQREAAQLMVNRVRVIDELVSIEIPDMRGAGERKFDWLVLEADDNNISGQTMADIEEFLDETSLEQVVAAYKDLMQAFKNAGVVIPSRIPDGDLTHALLNGDEGPLTIKVATKHSKADDPEHTLHLHLPTGTFMVSCKHDPPDLDEIAHAWEESLVRAELTGRKDHLLAYAEEYTRTETSRRATKTVAERNTALGNN